MCSVAVSQKQNSQTQDFHSPVFKVVPDEVNLYRMEAEMLAFLILFLEISSVC
jgi:hypothetical protein